MTLKIPKIELTKQNAIIFTAKLPLMKQHQEELWQSLSGQEKIQAEGFVNNTLKDKYILSHGLLRYLLSLYVERNPQDIQYLVNQFGKPFLKDDNCTLQFNMSHSKDYAVYIIALEDQVGIDIEWKDKDTNIQEIFELVLSPTEVTNFNQLNSEEKFHAFYCIWTKKEAIIKAIGQGLSYPIKTIEIMNSAAHLAVVPATKCSIKRPCLSLLIRLFFIPSYITHFCVIWDSPNPNSGWLCCMK